MDLSPEQADLSGPTVKDNTAPEGLLFQYAKDAKPLATPWQVAVERAKLVRKMQIPKGVILDPACGSGIQLAAYCAMMGREGFGIELDEPTAKAAVANLRRVADQGFDSTLLESTIRVGDGTIGDGSKSIAMLHIDPARPRNSRTHGLEEMAPQLPDIFSAWKDHLSEGERGPAILLDLSPRLVSDQRKQVELMVEDFWPGIGKTWVWTSRGRGRVDRLSLWIGQLSSPGISRRFIRIPPDMKDKPVIVEGDYTEISAWRRPPRKGDFVSLLDAALVESGLAPTFFDKALPGQEVVWGITSGRRPQIHHPGEFEFTRSSDKLLVQASGKIVKLIHADINEENLPLLIDAARELGFGKLTLRVQLDPEVQPRLQGSLDRQLAAKGGDLIGFVAKQPDDSMLLLCRIR